MWLVLSGIGMKIGRKKYYLLPKYFLKCSFTRLLYLWASEMMGLGDVVSFRLQLEQFKNASHDLSDPLFNDQHSFRSIFFLFHLRLYGLYWNKVGKWSGTQVWFGYGRVMFRAQEAAFLSLFSGLSGNSLAEWMKPPTDCCACPMHGLLLALHGHCAVCTSNQSYPYKLLH